MQQRQWVQPNFMTDTVLGTENSKLRIFSFILEIQCMQPNFKTVTSRNFIQTMYNGNHAKLLISSFKLQMQDIQPNFMIDTRGSFIQSMNNRGNAN